ncbi:G patch domain-containing protein 4, partial [Asbolus verrucosus]
MSEALKPKLKFDNSGIGHDVGDQFTNNWWERLFNNASKNINVQVKDDRVKLQGARHGLKLSGKLSRIEKQEKLLLKKMKNVSLTDDSSSLERKMKKLKKHKEETTNTQIQESEVSTSSSTKKIKNKRKSVTFNNETVVKYYTPELDTSHESNKDENSNSPGLPDPNLNVCDEGIEQDIEDNSGEQSDTHRSFEEVQRTFNDLSKAERKKLKKKRKLEKKRTATVQFIEEVREQMCIEENCKKRKLVADELDLETKQNQTCKYSKKKKYVPEKLMRKKEKKREKKIMKSIVESLDNLCRISDDE